MELEAYSPYKRSIMKNAKVEFPDEHNMRVTVSDQVYDKEAVDDILRILDRVFNERCGFAGEGGCELRRSERTQEPGEERGADAPADQLSDGKSYEGKGSQS